MQGEPQERDDSAIEAAEVTPKVRLSPWLVFLGIVALLVGLLAGIIMAAAGA